MKLQLELSEALLDAIRAGETKTLSCKVTVSPKKTRQKKVISFTEDEKAIIEYWNTHPDREELVGNRNLKCIKEQLKTEWSKLRQVVEKYGLDKTKEFIDTYQAFCLVGDYVRQDRNLAYKTLGSFCNALLKSNEKWWNILKPIKDDDEEMTFWIADSFAAKFLNRKSYGLKNPSKEYKQFQKGQQVVQMIEGFGFSEAESLKKLLACLSEAYGTKTVYPASISSEHTIKVLLPQYMKRHGFIGE